MAESFLEDFTFVVPSKKIFRIGTTENPIEIDISLFPARAMMKFLALMDKGTQPTHTEMLEIVAEACRVKNPQVTVEWLLDNSNFAQLSVFTERVMKYGKEQIDDFSREYKARYPDQFPKEEKKKEGEAKNSRSEKSS